MATRMFFKSIFLFLLCFYLLALGNCTDSSKKAAEQEKALTIDVRQPDDLEAYITNLLNKQLLPPDYNKNIRPNYGGKPVQVNIGLMINDISSITETSMDYKAGQVDFYIRQYWNDHRLNFTIKHNVKQITVGDEFAKKLWLPDTFIGNAKEMNILKTVNSAESTLFRVSHNGDIIYSTRIIMTANCPMDLTYFPMDQQKCSIVMESYGETTDEVVYSWKNSSSKIEFNSDIFLPAFKLAGYNTFTKTNTLATGDFSRVHLDIFFTRFIGFYVSQVYIPSILVVIISWIPFWLDRHDHNARVALGVTTVLTMTTLITDSNDEFPKISHLRAIDLYLFTCFVMVFLSLIEYATVGYYELKRQKKEAQENLKGQPKKVLIEDTSKIDFLARRLFPGFFIIFNVLYIFLLSFLVSYNSTQTEIEVKL